MSASGYGQKQMYRMLDFMNPNGAGTAYKAFIRARPLVRFMTRHADRPLLQCTSWADRCGFAEKIMWGRDGGVLVWNREDMCEGSKPFRKFVSPVGRNQWYHADYDGRGVLAGAYHREFTRIVAMPQAAHAESRCRFVRMHAARRPDCGLHCGSVVGAVWRWFTARLLSSLGAVVGDGLQCVHAVGIFCRRRPYDAGPRLRRAPRGGCAVGVGAADPARKSRGHLARRRWLAGVRAVWYPSSSPLVSPGGTPFGLPMRTCGRAPGREQRHIGGRRVLGATCGRRPRGGGAGAVSAFGLFDSAGVAAGVHVQVHEPTGSPGQGATSPPRRRRTARGAAHLLHFPPPLLRGGRTTPPTHSLGPGSSESPKGLFAKSANTKSVCVCGRCVRAEVFVELQSVGFKNMSDFAAMLEGKRGGVRNVGEGGHPQTAHRSAPSSRAASGFVAPRDMGRGVLAQC